MGRMKSLLGVLVAVLLLVAGAGIAGAVPRVVIDNSHGQIAVLSGLEDALRAQGWDVASVGPGESVEAALGSCNLLVVPQPLSEFTDAEVQAVHAWVETEGGGLLVLYDTEVYDFQLSQSYLNDLPAAFGVTFNAGVVWDYDWDFYDWIDQPVISVPTELRSHPLFTSVPEFFYLRGTSLNVLGSPQVLVRAGKDAYCDSGAYYEGFPPVLVANQVGAGRAVFFGDTDSLAANQQLFANIFNWLRKPESAPPEEPQTIEVTIDLRPRNPHNKINLHARGLIRVAIMSDSSFQADQVDPKSVVFAGASPVSWKLHKVNRDAQKDLVLVFRIPDLRQDGDNDKGLTCTSTKAELTGYLWDDTPIIGSVDPVHIVQNKYCKKPPKNDNCGGKKGK